VQVGTKMIFDPEKQQQFSKRVENYVKKWNGTYLDAVVAVSEDMEIEPDVAAKFLTKPIVEKIEQEGRQINLLPKIKNRLPI
jgi:hypothetical protein